MKYSFFLLFLPLSLSSQSFQDPRDGQSYTYVELGTLHWMTENLRYEATSSECLKDCDQIRFYDFNHLEEVCPEGWRLPEVKEWDAFVASFEGVETARMFEKNDKLYHVDFLDKYNILASNALAIEPYGRMEGGKLDTGYFIDFWTTNKATDARFHMHVSQWSLTGHAHKHHLKSNKPEEFRLFPVRCVCEEIPGGE